MQIENEPENDNAHCLLHKHAKAKLCYKVSHDNFQNYIGYKYLFTVFLVSIGMTCCSYAFLIQTKVCLHNIIVNFLTFANIFLAFCQEGKSMSVDFGHSGGMKDVSISEVRHKF